MGRTSGTPNKITAEVRDKLQNLIDELVNSLDIQELDNNQKIKMLQIALQYTLPRLQSMMIKEEQKEDEPIFIEDMKETRIKMKRSGKITLMSHQLTP